MNHPVGKFKTSQFQSGQIYSLGEIATIATRFKSKTFLRNKQGIFHLYQNQVDKGYWIGGPFEGEGSNLFLFLGFAKSEKEMKKLLQDLRSTKKSTHKPNESYQFDDFFPVNFDRGFYTFLDHLAYDFDDFFDL